MTKADQEQMVRDYCAKKGLTLSSISPKNFDRYTNCYRSRIYFWVETGEYDFPDNPRLRQPKVKAKWIAVGD